MRSLVVPELEGLAEQLASRDDGSGSLYLPSYLPMDMESVEGWEEQDPTLYEVWGDNNFVKLEVDPSSPFTSDMPAELAVVETVVMADGAARPYVLELSSEQMGGHSAVFGPPPKDRPVRLQLRLSTGLSSVNPEYGMTSEEFFDMFSSMVEIEPSGGAGC